MFSKSVYMRFIGLIVLLMVYTANDQSGLVAQNIIPDPGFEDWNGTSGAGGNTLTGMTHWYNASGTSDHHHVDLNPGSNLTGLNPCPLGDGRTDCGFPVAGGGVMGCWKGNGEDGSKEWAGTALLEPTVPGDCYEVSFWVQNKKDRPDAEFVTNQWGVFFSETEQPQFNASLFNFDLVATQWVATDQVIDGSEWQLIELNFEADRAYTHLFLGFMGNVRDATQRLANPNGQLGCYVWFDELYVNHVDVEVPSTINICAGEEATIEFVSSFSISWTDGTTTDTTRSFVVAPLTTTTYYVTATGNTGCTKLDSVTVIVDFPTNTDLGEDLCTYSDPVLVDATAGAGRWVGPGITASETGSFDPAQAGPGQHTIFFLSDAGCAASASYTITVRDVVPPELTIDAINGCTPLTVSVGQPAGVDPPLEYRWAFGDTTIISTDPAATYTFYQGGEYVVSAELVYSPSCVVNTSLPATIQVYQSPVADFVAAGALTNLEGYTTFRDRSEGEVIGWDWDVAGQAFSNRPDVSYEFDEAGDYEIALAVIDQFGCTDTSRQVINVKSDVRIYLPNAFSPNGDGINDRFEPGIAGELTDFQLEIYNRWGGLVFQATDPETTWDGRGRNGEPVAVGTYLYAISYRLLALTQEEAQGTRTLTGNLTLLR